MHHGKFAERSVVPVSKVVAEDPGKEGHRDRPLKESPRAVGDPENPHRLKMPVHPRIKVRNRGRCRIGNSARNRNAGHPGRCRNLPAAAQAKLLSRTDWLSTSATEHIAVPPLSERPISKYAPCSLEVPAARGLGFPCKGLA